MLITGIEVVCVEHSKGDPISLRSSSDTPSFRATRLLLTPRRAAIMKEVVLGCCSDDDSDLGGFERLNEEKENKCVFYWDNTTSPLLLYNWALLISCLIIAAFAVFSLVVEASVHQESLLEVITLSMSFAVISFASISFTCCSLCCFASNRSRVAFLGLVRTVLTLIVFLELVFLCFGVWTFIQFKELSLNLVSWTRFIQYYQEDYIRDDLDSIQRELRCCGFEGYQDWDYNPYYSCNSSGYSRCSVPYSCCRLENPDSSCVLGVRQPGLYTMKQLTKLIYVDGCLKSSQTWYKYTIILLVSAVVYMWILQLTLRVYTVNFIDVMKKKESGSSRGNLNLNIESKADNKKFVVTKVVVSKHVDNDTKPPEVQLV